MPEGTTASDYAAPRVIYAAERFGGSKPPGPPLQPPGGGGTYDGMLEARVAALEADVKNIRENIGEMKADLKDAKGSLGVLEVNYAAMDVRVQHLPTFKQNFALLAGMLAIIAALVVFQGHVQRFIGTAPASSQTAPTPPTNKP